MKRFLSAIFTLCAVISLMACGNTKNSNANSASIGQNQTKNNSNREEIQVPSVDITFSASDSDSSYDAANATTAVFSDDKITVTGQGTCVNETTLFITSKGTYVLSGNCQNGKICVSVGKNDKVKLVLDGLSLACKDGAALIIQEGDKVILTLANGSENSIADGVSYTETIGETNVDGTIFSRADLTVNGEGTLTVAGNNKHGIVSKDDLVLSGTGILNVTATGVGLEGKDCVKLRSMQVNVVSGTDGIRATNEEDAARGYVYMESGKVSINAQNDGIQAQTLLRLDGGELILKTGGGSAMAPIKQENDMMGGFRPGIGDGNASSTNEISRKGLKGNTAIVIGDAEIQIDSYDDGIHSNGDVSIGAGKTEIKAGDDGIHADQILEITGGRLSVAKSYEALEACKVYVMGGNISLVASDDGINASDASDSTGGFPGGIMGGSSSAYLCISGGYLLVNAGGDGLDSNGDFEMMGGVALVSGPTNGGNGALDYGEGCKGSVSGGILIALGSAGMAENFTDSENQGAMLINTGNRAAGESISVCDDGGKVLASFTSPKTFQTAVITCPEMQKNKTYTVYVGATVQDADTNGFANGSTQTGGAVIATVTLHSLLYGSGGMGSGGMKPPYGGGGMRPPR